MLVKTGIYIYYSFRSASFVFLLFTYRCTTDDTALYTAVATNIHGQASSQAAVVVKSKSFYCLALCLIMTL